MIKTTITILVSLLLSTAYAADISFRAEWEGPTTRVDGTPGTATDFVLYVCDQPIESAQSVGGSLRGSCEGNMQSFITTSELHEGVYSTELANVRLYARVSAREHVSVGGETMMVESDLSGQAYKDFISAVLLSPPGHIDFTGPGPAIIMIK